MSLVVTPDEENYDEEIADYATVTLLFRCGRAPYKKIDGVVAFALLLSDEQMVGLIKHRRHGPKQLCEVEGFVLLDGVEAFTNFDGASVALFKDGVLDRFRHRYQYKQVGSRPGDPGGAVGGLGGRLRAGGRCPQSRPS